MSTESFAAGFGTARYGNGSYGQWKLEDGKPPLIVRILPPMKSLAAKGNWSVYFGKVWGWEGLDPSNPTKRRPRPFLNLDEKDRSTGMVTFRDAASKLIEEKVALKKKYEEKAKEKGWDRDQLMANPKYKELFDWCYKHSIDRKHYVACMNQQNEFGLLRITHTCMKKLQEQIKKQINKNRDPLSLTKGLWWSFSRSGKGFNTEDTVMPYTVTQKNGDQEAEVLQFHTMTQELIDQALAALPDLAEFRDSFKITAKQIEELVACSGDPKEVDRIMGKAVTPAAAAAVVHAASLDLDMDDGPSTSAKATAVEDDDLLGAETATPAPVAAKTTTKAAPAAKPAATLSDDDFDKAFE